MNAKRRLGEIGPADFDQDIRVQGWVEDVRKLGGIAFVILRQREGTLQLAFPKKKVPELLEMAGNLTRESVIEATGTVSGPGGTESRSLDERASTGSITGAVGGYAQAWPAKRLALYADFLYIKVSPGDAEASVTDWRAGANYYFTRNVGLGAQYKHYNYSYDRGVLVSKLGGEITYEGGQVFLSFLF